MSKLLIVVDMQNDFIYGTLGTPEAQQIVPNVISEIEEYNKDDDSYVLYTQDTHFSDYLQTQEGKKLPVVHCVKPTKGWQIPDDIAEALSVKGIGVEKTSFGIVAERDLPHDIYRIIRDVKSIKIIGVCTDICVVSIALILKAYHPEIPIIVDAACCAGTTPEKHKAALQVMKSCQVEIINEEKQYD